MLDVLAAVPQRLQLGQAGLRELASVMLSLKRACTMAMLQAFVSSPVHALVSALHGSGPSCLHGHGGVSFIPVGM
jgi:hypothetical protein